MKWVGAVIAAIAVLLGGLWLLQGSSLVSIAPILCVADCAPLEGPSAPWALAGLALLAAGLAGLWLLFRRR